MRTALLAALVLPTLVPRPAAAEAEPVAADVPYYGDEAPDDYAADRCKLDLYRPEGVEGYPTIVFFHGGALRNGNRRGGDDFAAWLVEQGIGAVLVDYRLSPRAEAPAYVEDAAAAVAWTIDHVGDYGGDPEGVFVSGHSAGGYLTAMVGLDPTYLEAFGHEPGELAGLVPVAGQMITHSTVRAERGISENRPLIDAMAPAYHVDAHAPPMLCLAASDDLPARAEENEYFVAAMEAVGHRHVACLVVDDRNHGTVFGRLDDPGDPGGAALLAFVREHAVATTGAGR